MNLIIDENNKKVLVNNKTLVDFRHRYVLFKLLLLYASRSYVVPDYRTEIVSELWGEYNPLTHDKLVYTAMSRLSNLLGLKYIRSDSELKITLK